MIPVLTALLLTGALTALGTVCYGQLPGSMGEKILFAFGLGWIIVSPAVLITGTMIGTQAISFLYFILVPILLWQMIKHIGGFLKTNQKIQRNQNWESILLYGFALLFLALLLFFSRLPVITFDALVYHLGLPHYYLLSGKISYVFWSHYSALPLNTEMLYLLLLPFHPEGESSVVFTSIVYLACIGVGSFSAGRLFDYPKLSSGDKKPTAALFAAVGLLSLIGPFQIAYNPNSDLSVLFFQLLSLLALCFFHREKKISHGYLSVLFAGAAIACKWTAGPISAALLSLSLFKLLKEKTSRKHIAGFLLLFSIPGFIWAFRAWAYTSNPFYPVFYHWFGGADWSLENQRKVMADISHGGGHLLSLSRVLLTPFKLFWKPNLYGGFAFLGFFIPLALIPTLGLLRRQRDRFYPRAGLWVFTIGIICWFGTSLNLRYIYIIPFMAVIAASGAMKNIRSYISTAIYIAACGYSLFNITFSTAEYSASFFSGKESRASFLSRAITPYIDYQWMKKNIPKDSVVLFAAESRIFYSPIRCIAPTAYDKPLLRSFLKRNNNTISLQHDLAASGFDFVFWNPIEARRLRSLWFLNNAGKGEKEKWNKFIAESSKRISRYGNVLIDVRLPPAGAKPL